MTPPGRPRTAARLGAVQALFQSEQSGETTEAVIDQFVRHRLGRSTHQGGSGGLEAEPQGFDEGRVPDADVRLFRDIVRTASLEQDRLDVMLAGALPPEWPFTRLDPVLRAVLRAASAELVLADGPPARVVINEYLDVSHAFFDGDEPRMVNGMLNRLARELRAGEFATPGG